MFVYVLTVVLFMQGGMVLSNATISLSADDCETSRPLIEARVAPGTVIEFAGQPLTVVDADVSPCTKIAKHDHA